MRVSVHDIPMHLVQGNDIFSAKELAPLSRCGQCADARFPAAVAAAYGGAEGAADDLVPETDAY